MKIIKTYNSDNEYSDLTLIDSLKNYIEKNNINLSVLSKILSIDRKSLNTILNGGDLKLNYALRISNLLNLSNDKLIENYLKSVTSHEVDLMNKSKQSSYIIDNFDIEELKKNKIISSSNDYDIINNELCYFFGFKSIFEYSNIIIKSPLFSKSKINVERNKEQKAQDFWIKSNILSFQKINNTNEYNNDLLIEFIKRINPLTKNTEEGFNQAIYVLYQLGVTVLVQSYIPKTKAYGLTMIVNNKPCIVITDMGKKYHKLWFTLLHELYHVLFDFEYLQNTVYHISMEDKIDLFLSEEEADKFGVNSFISEEHLNILKQIITNKYKTLEMAKILNIHPSIVYGAYLETLNKDEQKVMFPKYMKYLDSSKPALKNIIFDIGNKKNIDSAIESIKHNYKIMTA
ncbi:hypothetical protein [Chishuiella sp.]|uniref:ImmA/IrrE family metallo-endopeptidase n=1 Tax=Chishuiella sp. TaxID=1969467 RepID=UPI0028AF6EDD|nr:hypothetical protein [Chishuiella sp.]